MSNLPYRFSQRVDNYLRYRPHYPPAVLDFLKAECALAPDHRIADVGSGTGILAELFLNNGNPVVGVEPDPDMRAAAQYALSSYPNYATVEGTAEATTLPEGSVDFVTAGQSFHWFDLVAARREFRRILVPGGYVVVVWNGQRPAGTPFLEALQAVWVDRRYRKPVAPAESAQRGRAQRLRLKPEHLETEILDPFFGRGGYRQATFDNPLHCDREALVGRFLSNSRALEPADAGYDAMIAALEGLFDAHQVGGRVTIEHDTRVVVGRL